MSAPENSALIGYVAIESGQLLLVDLGMLADPRVVVSDNARVALSKRKRVTTERKCVATPIVGAILARVGVPAAPATTAQSLYSATSGRYDVTSGRNGTCTTKTKTTTAYLCTAGVGYDGPTGLGVLTGWAPSGS